MRILLALLLCAASAHAQEYPAKPIRFIVATAPGGYTLAQIQVGNVAINPFLVKNMPFDPLADLAPVAPLTSSPVVVAIGAKLPAATLGEFIELARREPGRLHFGTADPGTIPHLAGELLSQAANVKLTAVHYRGAAPALTDLLAGQVQAIFVGLGVVRTHAAEAGLPGFELNTWFGVVAPKGTPERIITTLVRQVHAMQDDPAVQKRLMDGGMEVLKESPAEFRARMLRDHERFREILKTAGLKPE